MVFSGVAAIMLGQQKRPGSRRQIKARPHRPNQFPTHPAHTRKKLHISRDVSGPKNNRATLENGIWSAPISNLFNTLTHPDISLSVSCYIALKTEIRYC